MSVQSEIDRINQNVSDTYSVLDEFGADMPETRNTANMSSTAASIKAVLYNKEQILTEEEKALVRSNIGIGDAKSKITVTLLESGWSSLSQAVTANGVTSDNDVIVSPKASSHEAYCENGVYCSAQSSGKLTFVCKEKPSTDLAVNVMILG
jgi:hypothetical protein